MESTASSAQITAASRRGLATARRASFGWLLLRGARSVKPPALGWGSFGWLLLRGARSVKPPALGRGSFGWLLLLERPLREAPGLGPGIVRLAATPGRPCP